MGQLDKQQLSWGIVLGIITFGLMMISYNVGLDKGKEQEGNSNSDDNVLSENIEVNPKEVYIDILNNCDEFLSERPDIKEYCISYQNEESAFTAMERLAEENDTFSFEYSDSDFGIFITGVNEYTAEVSTEFWSFLINDEMSIVGVSDYVVVDGDTLGFIVEELEM